MQDDAKPTAAKYWLNVPSNDAEIIQDLRFLHVALCREKLGSDCCAISELSDIYYQSYFLSYDRNDNFAPYSHLYQAMLKRSEKNPSKFSDRSKLTLSNIHIDDLLPAGLPLCPNNSVRMNELYLLIYALYINR
jgi:hypothetical protein